MKKKRRLWKRAVGQARKELTSDPPQGGRELSCIVQRVSNRHKAKRLLAEISAKLEEVKQLLA